MEPLSEHWFDHEKLDVYQEAVQFVGWLSELLDGAVRLGDIKDQLDRASNSIVLNIAEGNGKYSVKDRCRFLDTANASALECAAGLDILVVKRKMSRDEICQGKESLRRIVQMLMGMIRKSSTRPYFNRQEHAPDGQDVRKS